MCGGTQSNTMTPQQGRTHPHAIHSLKFSYSNMRMDNGGIGGVSQTWEAQHEYKRHDFVARRHRRSSRAGDSHLQMGEIQETSATVWTRIQPHRAGNRQQGTRRSQTWPTEKARRAIPYPATYPGGSHAVCRLMASRS